MFTAGIAIVSKPAVNLRAEWGCDLQMLDLVCFKKRRVIEEDIFVQSTHSEECAKV